MQQITVWRTLLGVEKTMIEGMAIEKKRARSDSVRSVSVPPLASRYLFSQLRSVSGPTPCAVATSLIGLDVLITSRHSSSLNFG